MVLTILIISLIVSIITILLSKISIIISTVSNISIIIHGSVPLRKQEILGMPTMY